MSQATDMRDAYIKAELDILEHGQASGSMGKSLTMADLDWIRKGRKEWEARAAAEARPSGDSGLPHSLANLATR